jgi:asparagine synthase (glutamine-hydrolysing)
LKICYTIIEKNLLRQSFGLDNILPEEVLWRTKAAFSDAVSPAGTSWYKTIQNALLVDEATYYRRQFEVYYEGKSHIIPHYWMPKWVNTHGDPSATVLPLF